MSILRCNLPQERIRDLVSQLLRLKASDMVLVLGLDSRVIPPDATEGTAYLQISYGTGPNFDLNGGGMNIKRGLSYENLFEYLALLQIIYVDIYFPGNDYLDSPLIFTSVDSEFPDTTKVPIFYLTCQALEMIVNNETLTLWDNHDSASPILVEAVSIYYEDEEVFRHGVEPLAVRLWSGGLVYP